ncbi:hypothetical protein [uncultured Thiodictyon sp.]|jgi:hypothetical protein|uniref:hypothetical protein n=1 Tax=uncultured Thiodictyon sp. TaxID=1846217 RepID=UPI0025DF18B8|nr:hypothetical protein [uncultured Thiodictyon sp.]
MFEWRVPTDPLLDIALDHLTLARVRLLRALLTGHLPPPGPDPEALGAVAGLRRAGQIDYLPRGLLTAAWSQALRGDPDAARAALDEAHCALRSRVAAKAAPTGSRSSGFRGQ